MKHCASQGKAVCFLLVESSPTPLCWFQIRELIKIIFYTFLSYNISRHHHCSRWARTIQTVGDFGSYAGKIGGAIWHPPNRRTSSCYSNTQIAWLLSKQWSYLQWVKAFLPRAGYDCKILLPRDGYDKLFRLGSTYSQRWWLSSVAGILRKHLGSLTVDKRTLCWKQKQACGLLNRHILWN